MFIIVNYKFREMKMTKIQKILFELQDNKYREFQSSLTPTLEAKSIIGVRVPKLRALAKEMFANKKQYGVEKFFSSLPHKYLED